MNWRWPFVTRRQFALIKDDADAYRMALRSIRRLSEDDKLTKLDVLVITNLVLNDPNSSNL